MAHQKSRTATATRAMTLAMMTSALATFSMAGEVTLKSQNGSISLTGDLKEFDGTTYRIESTFGELQIAAEKVVCIGDACPAVDFATLKPVTWSVSLWGKRRAFTEHVEKLSELVAEKTEGQFRLNISYGGLSPSRKNLDGLSKGAFEMAQFCSGYHPDKNPSITVLELPFLGVDSMEQELEISKAVYAHPAVVDDFARWNATLLMPTPQPQYNIGGIGSPPTSLAAFNSMIVRATGGTADAVNALGAASVNLPAPEVQGALAEGQINAVAFAPHAHMAFNTIESIQWWTTNLNPGTANCPIAVNSDALAALPQPTREALLSSVDEALDHFIANYKDKTITAWEEVLEEREVMLLTFSDAFMNDLSAVVSVPSAMAWIEKTNQLGLPAQELYDLVSATINNTAVTN